MPLGANKAAIMGVAGVSTGDVVLLYDTDHTDAATVSITSGITSTYGEYIFKFYKINPAEDSAAFEFQVNAAGAADFNETMTTTFFYAYHAEDDSATDLAYVTSRDQAEGTAFQAFATGIPNDADTCAAGVLHLFNPSSTTYVKHFYSRMALSHGANIADIYTAGYINITAAIDEIQFKMASGNFDGTIKMWGVK
jgi:hypothetical protein